jgi:hypothetical protein
MYENRTIKPDEIVQRREREKDGGGESKIL